MRVYSARAKQACRIKLIFQRLLNSLLHRVQGRKHGYIDLDRSAGLLGSPEQGDLSADLAGNLSKCQAFTERRPNPALRPMPFNEGG